MQVQDLDVATMWEAIDALDFERIKAKLAHRTQGRLGADAIARAETGYRQFLKLAAKYPEVQVVPSEEVDEFWHIHILDTQRYAADCERIFGHMIHHDPYLGIDADEADEARRAALIEASQSLMDAEFGAAARDGGMSAAYCVLALAETASAAYCVRALADESTAAYCVRALADNAPAGTKAKGAYCVRPAINVPSAVYCVYAAQPAVSAPTPDAYCVREAIDARTHSGRARSDS
ncbi:hypothetical protein WKR88_26480 [Trinickia caryophylli]|uniref:Glycine-rich domain-containing protein-like n=1 Tax=Trinickia caryophylli TaxID=28094 RepID=A0A1X7GHT1_TRICW|nr:hypothetical protein [Trinickia caryophylli]WQE15508.1 hypothetical protein U0034_23585 [Trinickia caryophylli]GLU33744.1 hypothetical protein Busp01_35860 [Trinickia caryophylli]SMF69261.1 hypothetical protein SAMN06295900_115152 [Trinickia caryophylli]